MSMNTARASAPPETWEQEIRTLEEEGRVAFLAADLATLDGMWDGAMLVNSPLNVINERGMVLKLLEAGRIRHDSCEVTIERVARYGDVVVVMGRDTVDGPPSNELVNRRFTNVWQRQGGEWRMIARHAQVVPRGAPGT